MVDTMIIASVILIAVMVGVALFVVSRKNRKPVPLWSPTPKTTTTIPISTAPATPLWSLSVGAPVSGNVTSYLMNVNGILKGVYVNPMLVPTQWIIDPDTGLLTTVGSDGTVLAVKRDSTIVPYVSANRSSYATYDFQTKSVNGIVNVGAGIFSLLEDVEGYPNVYANKIQ
jgi:hypothetical protein